MDFLDNPVNQLDYEQAFEELEKVIAALESEQASLETATKLFERGQELTAHCEKLLDQAELKVRTLTGEELGRLDNEDGSVC